MTIVGLILLFAVFKSLVIISMSGIFDGLMELNIRSDEYAIRMNSKLNGLMKSLETRYALHELESLITLNSIDERLTSVKLEIT
jgi:hypothetical protein